MSNQLQAPDNHKSIILKQLSLSPLSTAITEKKFDVASAILPTKIELAIEEPKIREMIKAIGQTPVKQMIQFELIKLAELMSVGGNLNPAQVNFIAEQLIELYPTESIADFKICFRRGAMGSYGQIQRMDGLTIGEWMKEYLKEKYEVLENAMMKERDEYYKVIIPENSDRDWHKEWLEAVNKNDGFKTVPKLTEDEIKVEGQAKPKEKVYPFNESEAQIRLREHHEKLWMFQERTVRERHPELSEEEIQLRLLDLKNKIIHEETKPKHPFTAIGKIWAEKKKKKSA